MIRKKRILFSNPEVGKIGQPNEAPEDIGVEEGPLEKGWLELSSHKKRKNSQRRSAGSAGPPLTSKAGVHSSNVFFVIILDT